MRKLIYIFLLIPLLSFGQIIALTNQKSGGGTPPAQTGTPLLTNFRVENSNLDRIYYDSAIDETGLTTQGFTISGKTITSINTVDNYFTVSEAFDIFQRGRMIELKIGDGTIYDFTRVHIDNQINYPTPLRDRYVTITGAGTHDGSIGNEWNFGEAITDAIAGDLVHVISGNHGTSNYALVKSGTLANPIVFQGYKTIIGDINSMYWNDYSDGDLDSTEMPYFNSGNRSTTADFLKNDTGRQYYIFRNIQVKNYSYGIRNINGSNLIFERILTHSMGDVNGLTAGRGIHLGGVNVSLLDSRSVNAADTGIAQTRTSQYQLIENSKVFCNELAIIGSAVATDYYFAGNGTDNVTKGCYAERVGSLAHTGHGFTLKEVDLSTIFYVERNLIENCEAVNIRQAIDIKRYTRDNVIRGCTVTGDPTFPGAESTEGGLVYSDTASNTIVENCLFKDIIHTAPVEFLVTAYGTSTGLKIINTIFYNCPTSIVSSSANSNNTEFIHCTFIDIPNVGSSLDNTNSFKNSIFENVTTNGSSATFDFNNFNGGFTATGTNQYTLDPQFVDTINFIPQNASLTVAPLILGVEYDFNKSERSTTTTIGARKSITE